MRKFITILIFVLLSTIVAQGQIKIGGNVYGGGNHAEVKGSTKVTVKAGDIGAVMDPNAERPLADPSGKVFGGARMANVGGSTFVNIDGENATGYILINQVYGGNDIAGQIGTAKAVGAEIPTELTAVKSSMPSPLPEGETEEYYNAVDNTFNSYVRISTKATNEHYTEAEITAASTDPEAAAYGKTTNDVKPDPLAKKVYIGQLFGGGNGDFIYTDDEGNQLRDGDDYIIKQGDVIIARSATPFQRPELNKTYLEIKGGSIVYGYGGGNNATVKQQNIIHIDNPSAVVNHIKVNADGIEDENGTDLLTTERFLEMGINTTFSFPSSGAYQIGRFFGGNNKAEMHIRPTWNLLAGKVRNLYSGGNKGSMTSPDGLLLEIKDYSSLIVDNLFGGCRMADVMPTNVDGVYTPCLNLPGYYFPHQLSARVLVKGGHINNVYGGNDVTGKVWGGNAVGINATVYGDVYGGGNGAYPYTDFESMKDDATYGDFYFGDIGLGTEALNAFRPNAEQVSIHLAGTETKKTIIKGSVFVGGNCASLEKLNNDEETPLVELKIGSHVIADKVFLGNNGEKMVDPHLLDLYKSQSTMTLTDKDIFASYMDGVAMKLKPSIVFDKKSNNDANDYIDYSSMIGSFYGGGNRGSMMVSGKTTLKFDRKLIIFDKLVGGCNNANVEETELNAAYEGGLLGAQNERGEGPNEYYTDNGTAGGKIKDRLQIDLDNVLIRPQRWNDTFNKITSGFLTAGKEYYETDLNKTKFIADGTETPTAENPYYELATVGLNLEWNTAKWDLGENDFIKTGTESVGSEEDPGYCKDEDRRLIGGSVYGGCYNSGHVNGNVIININHDLVERDVIFAETGDDPYVISGERRTGVLRETQGDDVMSTALSVFGGGYGAETEIWGSTTINHTNGYAFQMFGGGEKGVVGKKNGDGEYVYNAAYSTTVNLRGINPGYSEEESGLPIPEAEYIYGAGCEGKVLGDSYVYLGNGRVYDAFGGASNADIFGGTEVHIGYNGGFPWVRDNVYGGNDFGGIIKGTINHTRGNNILPIFDGQLLQSSTYVKYIQGRVDSIFGGNYGSYNYANRVFKDYTDGNGAPLDGFTFPLLTNNSFVHFVPADNSNNHVNLILGGSEGFPGHYNLNNSMQTKAYVYINDTQTKDANRFANLDVYGGGAFAGVGTPTSLGAGQTVIDLFSGSLHNVYGGCNQEGLVGYTRVNVPSGSKLQANAIFGGGKGYDIALFAADKNPELAARYCDHYVTCIDFKSKDAIVNDAIYGGNENCRIACDTYINIEAPVMQSSGYQANIYGAGYGRKTLSGRTNVFMNNGSNAYKVFGGGRDGNAFNFASMTQWLRNQYIEAGAADVDKELLAYRGLLVAFGTYLADNPLSLPTNIGTYPNAEGAYNGTYTNDILTGNYHQTNVHILNGGNVSGYAYGGGYGINAVVSGSTYIELKGGNVNRDIYGGGEGGPVFDEFDLKNFTATTNVNIEGGMARNVYGGGYLGHVGKHCKTVDGEIVEADINEPNNNDIPAVANVTIGKVKKGSETLSFYNGVPAIQRNAYGGGEGGSVYGTTNLTINNGYIGYRYKNTAASGAPVYEYVEELDDQKPNDIELAGNAFGGGYVVNSYVDNTNVKMYGGTLRGSLYGGGEVGPVGRGTIRYKDNYSTGVVNGDARIYKAGKTHVQLFDGHVLRNVFGGGRGKDSWGGDGTMYQRQNMSEEAFNRLDLKCKGYVFGQTEVDVYGGEVGTDDGVALGYGNVFGAGDIGVVYSAYENENGVLSIGKKNGTRYDEKDNSEGYYYKYENGSYVSGYPLTEDCKVLIEPWCKANSNVNINGTPYAAGEYVPTAALNYLGNKDASAADWTALGKEDVNKEGIIIHNAVFAGGNTSPGSTEVYANTSTVFGNATASIHDVYNRDLISIGRGRVGGLYGDGNLTLVDGYRELNITNYGTDFYHINPEISLVEYNALPIREAAYYEIRYKCMMPCTDKDGKTYAQGSTITADEMLTVFENWEVNQLEPILDPDTGKPVLDQNGYPTYNTTETKVNMLDASGKPNPYYWVENGVCSRYAGRPMNTIQRADFCGVFGSRMVMQGAQDRVPEVVDYTKYTINRVREVSLNKKTSVRAGDAGDTKNKEHGNYFGIYSVVNYLGALTSDVDFYNAKRVTDNAEYQTASKAYDDVESKAYETATYYDWKAGFHDERKRNNGNSHNKVALASGVYLELTNENGTGPGLYEKKWGYITGVVELDLINVQPGMGGGYVYAKNEHGIRSSSNKTHTILTNYNTGAATKELFKYDETEATKKEWETSGNFIHSTQTIIDDCYNIGDKYKSGYLPPDGVPAHYWYIKGAVYVYDQYISAYTGNPNAFSEAVNIPLTITAASHGKMTLMNVQPNYYAYYSNGNTKTKIKDDQKIVIRDKEYGLNDVISYWDYSQLTATEKNMFERDTYVTVAECTTTVGTVNYPAGTYPAGTVLLKADYDALREAHKPVVGDETLVYNVGKEKDVDFDEIFRSSNNVSHTTGYILTYNVDNPNQWNTWYTPKSGVSLTDKVDSEGIKTKTKSDYEDGPTYTPNTTNMYGQNDYKVGSIISEDEYTTYGTAYTKLDDAQKAALGTQATFHKAYIVTVNELETTKGSGVDAVSLRLHKGATLAEEDYTASEWSSMRSSVDEAYVVTSTVQLSKTEFVYRDTYMSKADWTTLYNRYKDGTDAEKKIAEEIKNSIVPAYYCTVAGKYGGNYYEAGKNYRALAAFTAMSPEDREKFTFNYDALDLLIDPTYGRAEAQKYQYDGKNYTTTANVEQNKATYSLPSSIDYTATYKGDASLSYKKDNGDEATATNGTELTRTEFESLPNEQFYWAPITVSNTEDTYYVVKETIVLGDTPYAAGQVITKDTYDGLNGSDKAKVATLEFSNTGLYYYCRKGYTINASYYAGTDKTGAVTDISGQTHTDMVEAGTVINAENESTSATNVYGYENVINKQTNFSFHGKSPTETSTLFVTRGSDIFDLSKEKIITVIYQYDYVESDMAGAHITPVSERHVLNIHLDFKSGIPTVEDILPPDIILPGTSLSMPEPYVTPGAYEITGGGWKLFDSPEDAERHTNGVEYTNSVDPLYLYQHGHYLAYYAKSYLGETYSNHVPVSVANYHDLKKVMDATEHHYYIDHQEVHERLKVEPKIYINDYKTDDPATTQNGLDLFKKLYDLSLLTSSPTDPKDPLYGHNTLNERVKGANKLEFFMRTDIDYPDNPESDDWASIGTEAQCFEGTLHGDGHTIRGLDHSLFNNLCGSVYNLGVTGSFNEAGVVNKGSGYVESTWVKTTNNTSLGTKPYAVFGNPTDGSGYQVVNSYFWDGNNNLYQTNTSGGVTTSGGARGTARAMSAKEFYNGTVAYDLNNFYLHKRYANKNGTVDETNLDYRYFTIDDEGKLVVQPYKNYANRADLCSSGYTYTPVGQSSSVTLKYVEDRFKDGDFRYAGGTIPQDEDERFYSWTVTDPDDSSKKIEKSSFFPIWPDDYIFFGQKLTYGWAVTEHQEVPTAVTRNEGRLSKLSNANRVYRAPAYFRSKEIDVAHFNPDAYLAQKSNDGTKTAYPGMTAIDFAGHYDTDYILGQAYRNGQNWISEKNDKQQAFYPPLLDDDGLLSIINCDETRNLLTYAPAESAATGYANKATYDVLTGYFTDPAYGDYYNIEGKPEKYRTVADATSTNAAIYGHLVKSNLKATNDHLLVDKEDFNCPIAYQFDGTHRMWYQRKPEDHEYVDFTKGWQGISIPFTAELVTTDDKGEITHFYSGSETSKNGTGTKIGHEYWLREFKSISEEGTAPDVVAKASFLYPTATVNSKSVENTFLWDYYYENTAVHKQKDENKDTYQTYYEKSRNYTGYPLLAAATPYILGLPGETYYEFDLSGNFEAQHTAVTIDKLGRQTVSFVSNTGIGIDVSDDETAGVTQSLEGTNKNYSLTFKPSYMNENLTAGTYSYTLKPEFDSDGDGVTDCSVYDKVPASGDATKVSAFRPYFTATVTTTNSPKMIPERILFGNDYSGLEGEPIATLDGNLEINVEGHKIVATSHLKNATTVRIINVSGVSIANYVIQPGETVETPVSIEGVYIANKKKLLVK